MNKVGKNQTHGETLAFQQKNPLAYMTYCRRNFGCQMNVADGERVSGMLEARGCLEVSTIQEADIVVYLTCCVRRSADLRFMGQLASIKNIPPAHQGRGRIVAVGGCIAQRDGKALLEQFDNVSIVFGTSNLSGLPDYIEHYIQTEKPFAITAEKSLEDFSLMPCKREKPWHAWLPIMTGCDNFCTYCIVPYVRGRQRSRRIQDIETELSTLASQGVKEVTLLGQNVNSYGRDLYGTPRFADVLRAAGASGIVRVRFLTSHPKDISQETIDTMAAYTNIMPHLHLPVQSGSNRILSLMHRGYDIEHYCDIVARLRAAIKDISLSTDIMVGFPGETEQDFQASCDLVKKIAYSQVFTFIYSKRKGTPAAQIEDPTPHELIQERFQHLVDLVQASAYEQNLKDQDRVIPVLFESLSKRDNAVLTGRSPKNQTVHVPIPPQKSAKDFIGEIYDVQIDTVKTWYLQGHFID